MKDILQQPQRDLEKYLPLQCLVKSTLFSPPLLEFNFFYSTFSPHFSLPVLYSSLKMLVLNSLTLLMSVCFDNLSATKKKGYESNFLLVSFINLIEEATYNEFMVEFLGLKI